MVVGGSDNTVLQSRRDRRAELRNVIAMSIPAVITTGSRAVMDVADYVMITQLHVDAAKAAILPAQMFVWTYIIIGMGIVSMVNTFAAQSLGRKRYHECSAYAWQGLYIAVIVGVIALAFDPLLPELVRAVGHEADVQALELAYGRVAMLTPGPTVAALGLGWFFIGVHRPWITAWSAVEANIVNVVVSFVLIFGHLGFEPMGIAGAAWGTLTGVSYRAVRLALTLVSPPMAEAFGSRRTWRPSWDKLKRLLRTGIPCGVHWVSELVVWTLFVTVLVGRKFGTEHLVATNTAWQYMRIAFVPTIGIGQALTALVGKSIGSGHPLRAVREARIIAVITLVYIGSLSLVYVLFGRGLIGLFNDEPLVVTVGGHIMICLAVFQVFDTLGIIYNSALRGAGDTFVPSVFIVVTNWIVLVGIGWWVAETCPELGSLGPWMVASVLLMFTGVFLWWRWHGQAWMRIDLFTGTRPPKPAAGKSEEPTATTVSNP